MLRDHTGVGPSPCSRNNCILTSLPLTSGLFNSTCSMTTPEAEPEGLAWEEGLRRDLRGMEMMEGDLEEVVMEGGIRKGVLWDGGIRDP